MKTLVLFLCICFVAQICAQSDPMTYVNKNDQTHLLGTVDRSIFETEPYNEWYRKIYDDYSLDEETIEVLNLNYNSNLKIKIYLGTWCGDSKREVTKFLKLVDESNIDMSTIDLICLDDRTDTYKQGPAREEKGLNIHRVPTFIFYQNDEEVARIVESPVTSIEKDVAQIYAGIAPRPMYYNANFLLTHIDKHTVEETDSMIVQYARFFKRRSLRESELNTLGYVLFAADKIEEARLAFTLNTLLYPTSGNAFDSLAEAYMKLGKSDLAVENYMKSFSLDPKNENAITMIKEMVNDKMRS